MNPFSPLKQVHAMAKLMIIGILSIIGCLTANADDETDHLNERTLLIINSYNENAPWSQSLTKPINEKMSDVYNVHCEMVNMNSAEIVDSATYNNVTDKIFKFYEKNHPEYVMMIGNFAFTLRDRIKKEWGNVPIILVSRIERYAPLDYYFASYDGEPDWDSLPSIEEIRKNYNMTLIVTPDFYKENIDLMVKMLPKMKKIVFISDKVYTNRSLNFRIKKYLKEKYPRLGYEWLQARDSCISRYQNYMLNQHPEVGLLISTWSGNQGTNMMSVTGGHLSLISSAANPVFSIRESYLSLGAFGGVFHNSDDGQKALTYSLDKMLEGYDMRKLPAFIINEPVPMINHQRMLNLNIAENNCPPNTKFIFKAPGLWETYRIEIIATLLILLIIVIAVVIYIHVQRKRIVLLQSQAAFIKKMPWPYSKAKILYDKDGDIIDIEYEFEKMNSAFLKLLTDNLIEGMEWKMFPLEFIASRTKEMLTDLKPISFTYHFKKTDTYYEFMMCIIDFNKNKTTTKQKEVDLFANNITKRIKAQRRLHNTMRTLDITLNVAKIIPWQWDVEKGIIYYDVYRRLNNIKGTPNSEPTNKRLAITEVDYLDMINREDAIKVNEMVHDFRHGIIDQKRAEFRITWSTNKKERTEWVEINAAATEYNDEGKPKTVLGSLMVITNRKRQEQDLIDAKEKANESDRMKSAFLANMSHEIRTPLNAIVGFSSLITQTEDKAQKAKYSGIIEHNNELLLHLINDVLDLAKIESNTLELHYVDTDLNELMRSIYDTVRLRIAAGVMFNMVLGAEDCYMKADPNRLSQVLINLLTNSAKFTMKGSISFGYEINDNEIEFFVRDTGIGIAKENQQKLFHRFSKLNNFVQGTGLGLSICKSFVEKMGGTIGVKSRGENKGATFWFTLPFIPAEKADDMTIAEGSFIEQTPKMKEKDDITILVAEDNESNYLLFESILSKYYKLIHAYNGAEAVDLFKEHKPDLVLMDIRMPGMDGFEATAEIRKMSVSVPIIAVTAHAFVTEKDKILKSGFNGYVAKPINQKELMDNVRKQLSKTFVVF